MLEVPDWDLASLSYFGYGYWSLIHPSSKIWLYHDLNGAKNINVLQVLIWGFGGGWRFLTGIWNLDHVLDRLKNLDVSFLESPKSEHKGHGCSLHLHKKDIEPKLGA